MAHPRSCGPTGFRVGTRLGSGVFALCVAITDEDPGNLVNTKCLAPVPGQLGVVMAGPIRLMVMPETVAASSADHPGQPCQAENRK